MPTHYVEDYDGKRAADADPVRPESVEAAPVEDHSKKVVGDDQVEDKAVKKSTSKAKKKS